VKRIVLDANQFVSALLKPGSNSAEIISLVRKGILELVISEDIILEIRSVLLYPKIRKRHNRSHKYIDTFLKKLISIAVLTPEKLKVDIIKEDPSDNKYLDCAAEGKADFIISGDHHLKDLKMFREIRILDPYSFLKIINEEFSKK